MHALDSFPKHRLMAEQVTELLPVEAGLPQWSGVYQLSEHWLHYFITTSGKGRSRVPAFPRICWKHRCAGKNWCWIIA